MRDKWYADNRDLVKWAVLLSLAKEFSASRILQVAYYRPSKFGAVEIDGRQLPIPSEVLSHLRSIKNAVSIQGPAKVVVFDRLFDSADRSTYTDYVIRSISSFHKERCIVFLDPDTGLEPRVAEAKHVLDAEVRRIWNAMKPDDVLAFYQHQTNRNGSRWIPVKQAQLARAMGLPRERVLVAKGPAIARDVVFYFSQKRDGISC